MIQVHDLYKSFRNVRAVKGVSVSATDGQITGLLGPNGAGKTTILRVLYTVIRPDLGSATIDGLNTSRHPLEIQRRIGALPDSHGLYPRLTARENIRYYGRLHGFIGSTLDEQIERLIQMLDMQDFSDRKTEGFSSGQRIKVA